MRYNLFRSCDVILEIPWEVIYSHLWEMLSHRRQHNPVTMGLAGRYLHSQRHLTLLSEELLLDTRPGPPSFSPWKGHFLKGSPEVNLVTCWLHVVFSKLLPPTHWFYKDSPAFLVIWNIVHLQMKLNCYSATQLHLKTISSSTFPLPHNWLTGGRVEPEEGQVIEI